MRKQTILVAAHELSGGTLDKNKKLVPHVLAAGRELTPDDADRLGLTEGDVLKMLASGAIGERSVRAADDSVGIDDDVVDGVSAGEFIDFLVRHSFDFPQDATLEQLLALSPATPEPFDGISTADVGGFLDLNGIKHAADATAEDMLQMLLDHCAEDASGAIDPAIKAAADDIDKKMDLKGIKAELGTLQVPFETDANKPVLALLLAQSRAAKASAGS